MTLGETIKEQRTAHGLSQETLAEAMGVSRQAVTKWEAGQSAPSSEKLIALAAKRKSKSQSELARNMSGAPS